METKRLISQQFLCGILRHLWILQSDDPINHKVYPKMKWKGSISPRLCGSFWVFSYSNVGQPLFKDSWNAFVPLVNKHGNRKSLRIYVFHVVWCFPMQFYLVTGSWKHYIVTLDFQQTRLTKVFLYEGKIYSPFLLAFTSCNNSDNGSSRPIQKPAWNGCCMNAI